MVRLGDQVCVSGRCSRCRLNEVMLLLEVRVVVLVILIVGRSVILEETLWKVLAYLVCES